MKTLTLDSVANGALPELFERELQIVLANLVDVNTSDKGTRRITIEIAFTPMHGDRSSIMATAKVSSKLSGLSPVGFAMHVAKKNGKLIALSNDPSQMGMFEEGSAVPTIGEKPTPTLVTGGSQS